jgi:hypothetical protein
VTTVQRLPHPLEAAAYYVVSEALANAAKHAERRSRRSVSRCVIRRCTCPSATTELAEPIPSRAQGSSASPTASKPSAGRLNW